VQPVATWLVARPQNGVIALALSLLFPFNTIVSGTVMAHLALANGIRLPALQAVVAGAILALLALVLQASVLQIVLSAAVTWLPAMLLAAIMVRLRSLTLALQISVIIALLGVVAFHAVVQDPAEYWEALLAELARISDAQGLAEQAEYIRQLMPVIVPQMTMLAAFVSWIMYVMVLLLGYGLYQCLPGTRDRFGRFADLDLGRVLAMIMAVTSVGALASGAGWLQSVSFVGFAVFCLQGLAILHWLRATGRMPNAVLIGVYVMMPFLNVLLVMSLAVLGYIDAWFNFRARAKLTNDRN